MDVYEYGMNHAIVCMHWEFLPWEQYAPVKAMLEGGFSASTANSPYHELFSILGTFWRVLGVQVKSSRCDVSELEHQRHHEHCALGKKARWPSGFPYTSPISPQE